MPTEPPVYEVSEGVQEEVSRFSEDVSESYQSESTTRQIRVERESSSEVGIILPPARRRTTQLIMPVIGIVVIAIALVAGGFIFTLFTTQKKTDETLEME